MHAVGLHSALAIKRQRKRRDEQRRARERRFSGQSGDSGLTSPRASTGSLNHKPRHRNKSGSDNDGRGLDTKVVTSIGMLHIGIIFVILGAFLVISGLLPNDLTTWGGNWWNEMVATGLFAIIAGFVFIILNKVLAKKEENDLEEYVQRQLTRSRSGHRLERDVETGGLTTRNTRRAKQMNHTGPSSNKSSIDKSSEGNHHPQEAEPKTDTLNQPILYLEQISEEDVATDRPETSTTDSLSPGSPYDMRALIQTDSRYNSHEISHKPIEEPRVHQPQYVHATGGI